MRKGRPLWSPPSPHETVLTGAFLVAVFTRFLADLYSVSFAQVGCQAPLCSARRARYSACCVEIMECTRVGLDGAAAASWHAQERLTIIVV